jgi:Fe-Mn family superoxide dismutase
LPPPHRGVDYLSRPAFSPAISPAPDENGSHRTASFNREDIMAHTLPPLPYPADALEPSIDKMTMEIHHGRHHKTYVDNLNKALESQPALANKPIEQLLREISQVPENIRQAVINNGGGHANHTMFWQIMGPKGGGQPTGPLAEAITSTFGGLDNFKAKIKEAALGRFGSGWAWLVSSGGKLQVLNTANQDSSLMNNQVPILGVDVWEHAYYLKYQNKRADYVDAWWNVVNWAAVAERFGQAGK